MSVKSYKLNSHEVKFWKYLTLISWIGLLIVFMVRYDKNLISNPSTVLTEKQEINNKQQNPHLIKVTLPKQNILPTNELQIMVLRYEQLYNDINISINNKKLYRKQMQESLDLYHKTNNEWYNNNALELFKQSVKNQNFIEDNIPTLAEMRNKIIYYRDFNKFYKESYCLFDEKELPEYAQQVRFCLFLRKG